MDYHSLTDPFPIIWGFGIGLVVGAGWFYFTWYRPLKYNLNNFPHGPHGQ